MYNNSEFKIPGTTMEIDDYSNFTVEDAKNLVKQYDDEHFLRILNYTKSQIAKTATNGEESIPVHVAEKFADTLKTSLQNVGFDVKFQTRSDDAFGQSYNTYIVSW